MPMSPDKAPCLEQRMDKTSSMGAPVSVTDWSQLKLPRAVEHVAGFWVCATAETGSKTSAKGYVDLLNSTPSAS